MDRKESLAGRGMCDCRRIDHDLFSRMSLGPDDQNVLGFGFCWRVAIATPHVTLTAAQRVSRYRSCNFPRDVLILIPEINFTMPVFRAWNPRRETETVVIRRSPPNPAFTRWLPHNLARNFWRKMERRITSFKWGSEVWSPFFPPGTFVKVSRYRMVTPAD